MPSKPSLEDQLSAFARRSNFRGKGALCVALVLTERAKSGLPLAPEKLMTAGVGQVAGLGKGQVQKILARHGITRVLAEEGGRTSRGSVGNMRAYVEFLNELPAPVDCEAIEEFWITQVHDFFAAKPFKFRILSTLSVRGAVRDLLAQARSRQEDVPGARYQGAMLQHLIGAKLEWVLPPGLVEHHSASEADQAESRAGDFVVGDVAIHATTNPGEALMRKCERNIDGGLRPLIVTLPSATALAESAAVTSGIADRLELLDIEQFLAATLHERALFQFDARRARIEELVAIYNSLIDRYETDPSLKIEIVGH